MPYPNSPATAQQVYSIPGNSDASEDDQESVALQTQDINITKTSSGGGTAMPGETLTYTITVNNDGGAMQTGVTVTDNLPAGVTYVPGSTSVTTYAAATTTDNVRDEFEVADYSHNDGSINWSGAWAEISDDDDVGGGDIKMAGDEGDESLQIKSQNKGIRRAVDLTDVASATLQYEYRRKDTNGPDKFVLVQISSDGGSTWVTLAQYGGDGTDASYQSASHDITSYATANTVLRLISNANNNKAVLFDNIDISADFLTPTVVSGNAPPTVVSGQSIPTGESMVVTFDVTVDTPPLGCSLTNTASVTSDQQTVAKQDAATDTLADVDSDGDSIPNSVEDTNGDCDFTNDDPDQDGRPNYIDIDADNDGLTDLTEAGLDPNNPLNTDGTGAPDFLDIDADDDGIVDNVEGQSTADYTPPGATFTDIDNDGLNDIYDSDTSSQDPTLSAGTSPYNHDGADEPDYRDSDSDNDGINDFTEGHYPVRQPANNDADSDGLDDAFEGEFGGPYTPGDANNPNNGTTATATDYPAGNSDVAFRDETTQLLPVELTSFDATLDGHAVLLAWTTASETNNAGFNIEHRSATDEWSTLAWIDGHGTTEVAERYSFRLEALTPGRHTFRLKQIDYDGTFEYSPEVEVVVEMAERFVMESAYPNPFNPEAQFSFAVREAQAVEVALYDVLGRRVQVLWSGEAKVGRMQEVRIDGSGLSSGAYVIRVVGKDFVETQRVVLVK